MKYSEIQNLKQGQVINHNRGEELPLQFKRKWNDNLYIFNGLVFTDDEDMDGHFSEDNERVLTLNELKDWYVA